MAFDLCQVQQASRPYYIETVSTSIWSIEELCYYLYENVYLVDRSIVNEKLCDWIRDELGLRRLYRILCEQLERMKEKPEGIAGFILPIFREIGYLTPAQMRSYTDRLSRLEVQPGDVKQKLKGDYLVRSGMLSQALTEYRQILDRQTPGSLGLQFYTQIWNNLGCVYAQLFRFEKAAECFMNGWKLTPTREMLRKYASVIMIWKPEEYEERMKELEADPVTLNSILEYNVRAADNAEALIRESDQTEETPQEILARLKEEYRSKIRR